MSPTRGLYTLVFARREWQGKRQLLLGMKKRGFGEGRWNGFGGKVEVDKGETWRAAAARELYEECALKVGTGERDLAYRGELEFRFDGKPLVMEVRVFEALRFEGEPVESEEMHPQWWDETDLPFHDMWPDDRHWLPLLLAGKHFTGTFLFRGHHTILEQELKEISPDLLKPLTLD